MLIFIIALLVAVLVFFLLKPPRVNSVQKQEIQKLNVIMPNEAVKKITEEAEKIKQTKQNSKEIIKTEAEMPNFKIKLPLELQKFVWYLCLEKNFCYTTFLSVLYEESKFDQYAKGENYNKTKTRILSRDLGYAGLNDRFKEEHAAFAGVNEDKFDYFNPYHNIRSSLNRLCYIRRYWLRNGVNGDENLWFYMLNSYNLGIKGFTDHLSYGGSLSREYNQRILKWKTMLEIEGRLPY
jgi:hypothetical protein